MHASETSTVLPNHPVGLELDVDYNRGLQKERFKDHKCLAARMAHAFKTGGTRIVGELQGWREVGELLL